MKIIHYIILVLCSQILITVGLDKFLFFLEPPCSLMNSISPLVWKGFGVLQIVGGILIWLPKFKKSIASFFIVFMLTFSVVHLLVNTYDIAGSVISAVLLAVLIWSSKFIEK